MISKKHTAGGVQQRQLCPRWLGWDNLPGTAAACGAPGERVWGVHMIKGTRERREEDMSGDGICNMFQLIQVVDI